MICDIANAYPANGNCIDADKYNQVKFTFYGDYAYGAAVYVYYADTGEKLNGWYINTGQDTGYETSGFYNGEEIYTPLPIGYLDQNREYLWKARIYNKVIDISGGAYPDILVCKGNFVESPVITTTVISEGTDKTVTVETGLSIKIPSYLFIDTEVRKIVSYDETTGIITTDKMIMSFRGVGTEIKIYEYDTLPTIVEGDNCVYIDKYDVLFEKPLTYSVDKVNFAYSNYIKNLTTGEYIAITDFDHEQGLLYLETSFSSEPTSNDYYEIYCNYIDTPYFNFITKRTPVIVPKISLVQNWNTAMLKCEATVTAPVNITIKSYYWEIYEVTNNGDILVDTSKLIYSGRMEYLCRRLKNTAYKARIIVTTRDDVTITSDFVGYEFITQDTTIDNLFSYWDNDKNAVKLVWTNLIDNTSYCIMRTDTNGNNEYLETIIGSATEYYDYKVSNGQMYTYSVTPKTTDNIYSAIETTIEVNLNRMSIYFLSEVEYQRPSGDISIVRVDTNYMYKDTQYKVEKIYCIDLDYHEMKITHNINRNIQVGYNGLPIVTVGTDNYDSFPLEFTFGQVRCNSGRQMEIFAHTHNDYLEWRKYVASGLPVVIKDIMGNIWFGTITDHSPTPNIVGEPNLYQISLEFTQSRNMNETRILSS